jgi:hypothetical protein
MARYVCIVPFADIYDNYHDYFVGDAFPHDGRWIDPSRLNALLTNANALGKPLIKNAEEVAIKSDKKVVKNEPKKDIVTDESENGTNEDKPYTKSEINRSNLAALKQIASEVGIDGADDKTGGELKKLIIEKLGL